MRASRSGRFLFCTSDAALLRNSPESTFIYVGATLPAAPSVRTAKSRQFSTCGTYARMSGIFLPSLKAFLLYEPVSRFYASINVS